MKIIFGLGNPGIKYQKTRHNIGFMFLNFLSEYLGLKNSEWSKGLLGIDQKLRIGDENLILVKPNTYMNRSGDCIRKYLDYYNVLIEDILVVHDDLDIPLGDCKLSLGKGPKQHNGVLDIESKLNSTNFLRLRIGIENRGEVKRNGSDYVLESFTKAEMESIFSAFEKSVVMISRDWYILEKTKI